MLATCHSLSRMPAIRDSALTHRIDEFVGTEERHLYDSPAWQVLEERISDTPVTQYVWSPVYIDAMILRDRSVSGELDERLWVTHDANFNVTMLMDANGNVVERFTYTPFGVATVHAPDFAENGSSGVEWQYRHQGGRWSAESGLGHFRFRDLSTTQGRWGSNDPIGFQARDASLYRFVSNNPINLIDPSGRWGLGTLVGGIVGGIVGSVIGGVNGGLTGIVSGAIGGAIVGGLIGTGVPPVLAGAVGGAASSAINQWMNGEQPFSKTGFCKMAASALVGAAAAHYAWQFALNEAATFGDIYTGFAGGIAAGAGDVLCDFFRWLFAAVNVLGQKNAINQQNQVVP